MSRYFLLLICKSPSLGKTFILSCCFIEFLFFFLPTWIPCLQTCLPRHVSSFVMCCSSSSTVQTGCGEEIKAGACFHSTQRLKARVCKLVLGFLSPLNLMQQWAMQTVGISTADVWTRFLIEGRNSHSRHALLEALKLNNCERLLHFHRW